MIRYEGGLSELFCSLLCTTVAYSNMHMRKFCSLDLLFSLVLLVFFAFVVSGSGGFRKGLMGLVLGLGPQFLS